MIKEAIGKGETISLAQEDACRILGVETHEAEFEVLQMPVKKTLGLFGGKLAEVRAFIKSSPGQAVEDYIKDILRGMNINNVEITREETDNGAVINLSGEEVGNIIGRRGETLDAIQYLSGLVANHVENNYYRININIGNYREKREKTLEALGIKMARKSLKLRRNLSLEPMNPYERRIIHTAVKNVVGVSSWSEGEDLNRHVVIGIKNQKRRPNNNRTFNKKFDNTKSNNVVSKETTKPENQINNETKAAPLYGKIK